MAVYGYNCPVPVEQGESCFSTVLATFTVWDWLITAVVVAGFVGFAIWHMNRKRERRK